MKFKSLFLGMLGAAVMVSCNNDAIDGPNGGPSGGGSKVVEGESTVASFAFNLQKPGGTYSGDGFEDGATQESAISNVAMFIYKLDGTPEAMAYLAPADWANATTGQKITVKCKSGEKLIYVAANFGADALVVTGTGGGTTSNSVTPGFFGKNWNETLNYGPRFMTAYTDADGTPHEPLNAPIWSTGASNIALETTTPVYAPTGTSADGLIKALTGNGVPGNGVLTGVSTSYYLMTNWGDASTQPADTILGGTPANSYQATVKFTLLPGISADDSRVAGGDNNLKVNIQRAIAKISVAPITLAVQNAAGSTATNSGVFVPDTKWAVGNINRSQYPFQVWSGNVVRSTRYNDIAPIVPISGNNNWSNKLDNSRFVSTTATPTQTYEAQNLTVMATRTQINTTATQNQLFGDANYALVTECNNSQTYNHYSTFVVFAGQYKPSSYITTVSNVGTITTASAFPASWPATTPQGSTDTICYVGSFNSGDGQFFLGRKALQEYVCYKLNAGTGIAPQDPYTDPGVAAYINNLKVTSAAKQADLQEYYQGYCFYRIWIDDPTVSEAANQVLVRRNHIYKVSISNILGPGIGDPNNIIDPHPEEPDPIKEADTYVTATIEVMKWHIVNQATDIDLN
ncbi:MAG: fimbria major subunit [Tannerella sp.]|jgi:hypothetical protein|nr:fimbria major subunit [Tannerella sp.]